MSDVGELLEAARKNKKVKTYRSPEFMVQRNGNMERQKLIESRAVGSLKQTLNSEGVVFDESKIIIFVGDYPRKEDRGYCKLYAEISI
jgi:hypothetical protein